MRFGRLITLVCLALPVLGQDRPSFVILLADDLGVDGVGYTGAHPDPPPTPHIDQLAQESVVFTRAYVNPLCSPTRAMLLTGLDVWRTKIGVNVKHTGGGGLDLDTTTIMDVLGPEYRKVMLGKWHLSTNEDLPLDPPTGLGFDHFAGTWRNLSVPQTYWRWWKLAAGVESPSDNYATTDNVDDAIEELQSGTQPLFLLVSLNAPHAPWHQPPSHLSGLADSQSPPDLYKVMVEAMDTEIGRLLSALDQSSYADSTFVMFLGDNGTPAEAVRPPTRPDRVKGSLYEGGIHVPWLVRGPGVEPREVSDLIQGTDLFATVAELAQVDASTPDSISFARALRGEPGLREHAYLEAFGPWYAQPPNFWRRAAVGERWKLIEIRLSPDEPYRELYDLWSDPLELRDALELGPGALTGDARRAYALLSARLHEESGDFYE